MGWSGFHSRAGNSERDRFQQPKIVPTVLGPASSRWLIPTEAGPFVPCGTLDNSRKVVVPWSTSRGLLRHLPDFGRTRQGAPANWNFVDALGAAVVAVDDIFRIRGEAVLGEIESFDFALGRNA